jgi:hypothetical protein
VLRPGEGARQAGAAGAQRLDLAAGQHQPGLERVLDVVVEAGAAILDHRWAAALFLCHGFSRRNLQTGLVDQPHMHHRVPHFLLPGFGERRNRQAHIRFRLAE